MVKDIRAVNHRIKRRLVDDLFSKYMGEGARLLSYVAFILGWIISGLLKAMMI
jgi:hypothetical protein